MIKRHIIKEGPEKSGPKVGIGPALMAFSILLSAFVFAPDVVRSQTITFAGDADQGDQGRWMKSKVAISAQLQASSCQPDDQIGLTCAEPTAQDLHQTRLGKIP
jgi:hypothetical protein